MNQDDVQFILLLLDDMHSCILTAAYENTTLDFVNRTERARTILTKYVYRTKEDKLANPRQEELNFNDYRDWHSDPNWSDENDDED